MTDEKLLITGDRRHDEDMPGAIDIDIDSELLRIRSGGSGGHNLLFYREEDVKELREQLNRLYEEETDDKLQREKVREIVEDELDEILSENELDMHTLNFLQQLGQSIVEEVENPE